MKDTNLSIRRQQNAARQALFSRGQGTANFAPLWQSTAGAGALAGAMKGGMEQNSDGSQIDSGERLMRIGTNAAAGGVLLGAAGSGIPQLMKENPAALRAGQQVYDKTGVSLDNKQIPMSTADRIRYEREAKRAAGKTLKQRVAKAIDPVTGRLEILAEDVGNATRPVTNLVNKGVQAVQRASGVDPAVAQQRAMVQQAVNASIEDETARLAQQAVRQHLQSPQIADQVQQKAVQNANRFVEDVVNPRTPLQKGIDGAMDAGKSLAKGTVNAGRKLRSLMPFSYMNDTADFYSPYTMGAAGGAVLGTGIGGGIGIANAVNSARDEEQRQLDNIQAIPDPYARKKEWDVYDSDLSRAGRGVGYAVGGTGSTLANAGLGAVGGALLGGAALTGYENLRKNKFNGFGQPTPSRLQGLKTFITGR